MNYKNAYEEMKRLYTKLQQENEQLKEQIRIMREHPFISKFYEGGRGYGKTLITDLEQRINKAIEYIEEEWIFYEDAKTGIGEALVNRDKVLEILKGKYNNGNN